MDIFSRARLPLAESQFVNADTARLYDAHARRFMGPVFRRLAKQAAALNLPGNNVLDVGSGSGLLTLELAAVRPDLSITGIDIAEEMLALAGNNTARAGLGDRVDFQPASAAALPFKDNSFALVVSNASLHLWQEPVKVFNEMARVTAPGGYCLIWDNARAALFRPLLAALGRVMGMNAWQRNVWMQAVGSSYTAGEVKKLLIQTVMPNGRVSFNPRLFELEITWQKP